VTTRSNDTYRGVLWEKARDYLVLKGAVQMFNDAPGRTVDGDLLIFRENVELIQVFGGAD
jgi:hypothetical protein